MVSKHARSWAMRDRTQRAGAPLALRPVRADTGLCASTVARTNGDFELVDAGEALVGRSIAQKFPGMGWYEGEVRRYDPRQDRYEVRVREGRGCPNLSACRPTKGRRAHGYDSQRCTIQGAVGRVTHD